MSGSGITPISPITSLSKLTESQGTKQAVGASTEDFGQMLGNAINNLAQTENNANSAINKLATGEDIELHQVMLAMQEADIAFQVALQTRNKLVDAYQEIMRMQV